MDSATWSRTPVAASAGRRLRSEVSKNSSTALSSNEGELARSITTCAPAMASLSPSPVMVLTPLFCEAATTSWPPWRRMATTFEPIRPVPPMTTIFMGPPLPTLHQMRSGLRSTCILRRTSDHLMSHFAARSDLITRINRFPLCGHRGGSFPPPRRYQQIERNDVRDHQQRHVDDRDRV